jgi:D-glycero-D-manno-heptose 1,7-bisphosphate phosphatase|tara:strand:+ start:891 stop:1478 length:588 start_codon:yes stop_codon:yes gene_type:complete
MSDNILEAGVTKLVILDRDGVINVERSDFVKSADEWIPIEGSIDAIARLHSAGFTVVIATNQSGLARNKFDLDDLEAMHAKFTNLVLDASGEIGAIFYCPHKAEDNCYCRKPKAGLIEAIEAEFNASAEGMPFVGDSLRDLQAGLLKGCDPILVKTGNGEKTLGEISNCSDFDGIKVTSFDNLAAAVPHIIKTYS